MMEMTASFNKRMAEFQHDLQSLHNANSLPASTSPTSKLAAEFNSFQSFVLSSLKALNDQITLLSNQVNDLETRSRRKILLIHGIPEAPKEIPLKLVASFVSQHLKIPGFNEDAISRCHRLGVLKKDKPRPIVVKFNNMVMRNSIWFSKTELKGSGYTISEFLIKDRHNIFVAARSRFGVTNCWTKDGCIFVKTEDGSKHKVTLMSDLDNISASLSNSSPGAAAAASSLPRDGKQLQNVRPKRIGRVK
ncbi:unnamed protein product [Colias eurytheme]|nr:unnamed protein product [Colias eurytheme]